jgi:hypothetical protein
MSAFRFGSRRTRRLWNTGFTLTGLALFAVVFVTASGANLSGSTFEGNDGNLVVNTAGNTDWVNAPNRVVGIDLPSGNNDNSFGQGAKEDDVNTTVVSGSIPNAKADLARFAVATEFVNGSNYLYLAWTRENQSGTVNYDFEINKLTQPDLTTPGAKVLNRSVGDILINYAFAGGSNTPTLTKATWNGTQWANFGVIGSSFSEGATNSGTVSDILGPPVDRPAQQFGEAAINMQGAGLIPPGACTHFGSVYVKSRSSTAFNSEIKDFIAPVPVNINNCGTIRIHKVTENGDASFGYTTTGGLSPATFNLSNGGTQTYGPGTVLPGTYSVDESTLPAGWTFKSLVCTASGSGTSATPSGTTASITMGANGTVDCTYTNFTKLSPSISTTLSTNPVPVGATVHDSATLTGATANAGGTVTYTVYTNDTCTANPQDAGTKTVTNGAVPDSDPITFNSAGDFFWQAVYSGDANNNGATSACTSEHLVVGKNHPAMATAQNLIPNDDATISGATANAGGTITFDLFAPSDATCSGTPTLTQTVPVSGNGTYSTTNTTFIASAEGTWRWRVSYSGDANNDPATSACGVERFTIANS